MLRASTGHNVMYVGWPYALTKYFTIMKRFWPRSIWSHHSTPQLIILEIAGIISSCPETKTAISLQLPPKRGDCFGMPRKIEIRNQGYTCGRLGSTVPFALPVSGVPSPFVLMVGSLVTSVECFVSVFERPSCFPLCVFLLPAGLEVEAWCH